MFLLLPCGCYARVPTFEPFLGSMAPKKYTPKYSPELYFEKGDHYFQAKKFKQALLCFGMITHHFPEHALRPKAQFLTGICYLEMGHPDLADKALTQYQELSDTEYSEQLFSIKYSIAQSFANGKRKNIVALEGFPKLLKADTDALRIFDEIVTASSDVDLKADALYSKGALLFAQKEYSEAIKTLKKVSLQFPSHSLSPKAFSLIAKIYCLQALQEPYNEQYLQDARANAAALRKQHPNHPSNSEVANYIHRMCEAYASCLYSTGRFYEKKRKASSAKMYYSIALESFPETSYVAKCNKRLERLSKQIS
ncbi:tetratricopeptide repeat family protein [Chlamydia muridarum]|nr:tetratricopeptide repeat family protein [Chlamydia muridarum]KDU81865.1 tetratricopeptide repeat family protein [Chlamydia muridarum]KDU82068.1 tetratricopeptide repeat family protein [Chlamydia muridarum]KDU83819.1 tetratricopeptide repeat family protein [Chlamydia muridarum]KDU83947.1 tetratricopeptide repeat family protein [Chlamydia muridarum]